MDVPQLPTKFLVPAPCLTSSQTPCFSHNRPKSTMHFQVYMLLLELFPLSGILFFPLTNWKTPIHSSGFKWTTLLPPPNSFVLGSLSSYTTSAADSSFGCPQTFALYSLLWHHLLALWSDYEEVSSPMEQPRHCGPCKAYTIEKAWPLPKFWSSFPSEPKVRVPDHTTTRALKLRGNSLGRCDLHPSWLCLQMTWGSC